MKTQNNFLNDSIKQSPEDNYHKVGFDSYYINHPRIMTHNQILTKGRIYLLLNGFSSEGLYYSVVKIIDTMNKYNVISIILEEVHNETMFKVKFDLYETMNLFQWMIIDASNLQTMLEKIEVYDYCLSGKGL